MVDVFEEQIKFTENRVIMLINYNKKQINVYNDANRVKQVIMNLISNSLKFTEKGFIKVKAKPAKNDVRLSLQLQDDTLDTKDFSNSDKNKIKTEKTIKPHKTNQDDQAKLIKISIKDSGVGIPEQQFDKLFNLF